MNAELVIRFLKDYDAGYEFVEGHFEINEEGSIVNWNLDYPKPVYINPKILDTPVMTEKEKKIAEERDLQIKKIKSSITRSSLVPILATKDAELIKKNGQLIYDTDKKELMLCVDGEYTGLQKTK
jgi:hypothetical protein